jgi:hypothetical protein
LVISFDLPRRASVLVRVHDVLGEEIATLAHAMYLPGRHVLRFDAAGQASGVYYCTAEATYGESRGQDAVRATRAMLLVK